MSKHTPTPFFWGQLPVTIDSPPWVRMHNRFRASVYVGPNHFSYTGKTPERAVRCMQVCLGAFFAYGDSLRSGWDGVKTYADAARYSKKVRRAALKSVKS